MIIHKNSDLALYGGRPVRDRPFPSFPVIGEEEINGVMEVVRSGQLSMFDLDFLGGEKVKQFEENFAAYHSLKYAVSVNSGTSALHVALAAAGIGPGDEVIVPPYTFTATASSVLMNNAVPVFSDICNDTYCLDPEKIEAAISKRTRAIIPVHLFGHPADMKPILEIAENHDLFVIEDCAQAPGAEYHGKKVGRFGDLAAFSFQRTKSMTTGEGGMIITDDPDLAHRCRLIRNHGEAHVKDKKREYIANILGYNYRMTEMEAAIGIGQLKKLDKLNAVRISNSEYLTRNLSDIQELVLPCSQQGCTHVYGTYVISFDVTKLTVNKEELVKLVEAEGIPVWAGYPHPLYKNPIFMQHLVYGLQGCPYSCGFYDGNVNYSQVHSPVCENVCTSTIGFSVIRPPATHEDMRDVSDAIHKVIQNCLR